MQWPLRLVDMCRIEAGSWDTLFRGKGIQGSIQGGSDIYKNKTMFHIFREQKNTGSQLTIIHCT